MSICQAEGRDLGLIHYCDPILSTEIWLVSESPRAKKQGKPQMPPLPGLL